MQAAGHSRDQRLTRHIHWFGDAPRAATSSLNPLCFVCELKRLWLYREPMALSKTSGFNKRLCAGACSVNEEPTRVSLEEISGWAINILALWKLTICDGRLDAQPIYRCALVCRIPIQRNLPESLSNR